jgi:hypothetical protein
VAHRSPIRKRANGSGVFAVAALLLALAAGTARAAEHPGPLSPELRTLARPAVAEKPPVQQAAALGLPRSGPGSLVRNGGRVLVEARFDGGPFGHLPALRAAGADVVFASRRYGTATLSLPPAALPRLAAVEGLKWVGAVPAPQLRASECEGGSVISEGVAQLHAQTARESFGVDGQGVTVGVLSDSYNDTGTAPADVLSKDLPGLTNTCLGQQVPVDVRSEIPIGEEGTDEGRAMLQIVHDMAPAAKLAFASAYGGEAGFAAEIEGLAAPVLSGGAGAGVIVDDVAYFEEPFFQDGPIAAAVDKVTAEGVTYLSAAGNDNLIDTEGRNIASWEAPSFRDGGSCPAALPGSAEGHCMDFDPEAPGDDTFGITVEPQETLLVDLQWAEPWEGVRTDLDAYLLNASASSVLASADDDNIASQKPVELLSWENTSPSQSKTVQLVIDHCFGACNATASASRLPRLKFALQQNGGGVSGIEYPESRQNDVVGPTVYGHAGSSGAIAVGAVPFNDPGRPERYSSRGPVTHYFGPVDGSGPAAPLASAQVIPKPDVVATDCGRTTFFATETSPGIWRFCGTSAAAPHAAGVAALMMQKAEAEGGGLDQPQPIRAALLESAVPVGAFGACAVGAGLVDAPGALSALLSGPGPVPALPCGAAEEEAGTAGGGGEEPSFGEPAPIPVPPNTETPNSFSSTPVNPAGSNAAPQRAPRTRFRSHPPKVVGTRRHGARLVFRFASDQRGVSFLCRVDRGRWHRCHRRFAHRFGLGRHVVKARARSAAGPVDRSPAVFRFSVRRR